MTRLHVVVRGRVQGVGFRWFVSQTARALDLAGWVKNNPDRSVEVAAEGSADAVARLRAELERGPEGARVESVGDLDALSETLTRPFMIL